MPSPFLCNYKTGSRKRKGMTVEEAMSDVENIIAEDHDEAAQIFYEEFPPPDKEWVIQVQEPFNLTDNKVYDYPKEKVADE